MSHAAFGRLHPTGHHPERPERLQALLEAFPDWSEGGPATKEDLLRCHTKEHVEVVRTTSSPTWLDGDTICGETSYEAALLAAGTAIEAARRRGFAFVRPPGHHALAGSAMGFCLFNNIAIAARALQADGLERIAIVDFDVHHGNGTDAIFREDDTVLFVSLHQWPFYPGTGGPTDQAETTLNIPLAAGGGDEEYMHEFDRVVEPAVARFAPDAVLVSAGFDAHADDPLAEMNVTAEGFRELARRCGVMAPHVAAVLEGGYRLETLPTLVAAALEGFDAAETSS